MNVGSWFHFPEFVAPAFVRRETCMDLKLGILSGAVFDDLEVYRYLLWRCWNPKLSPLVACMLNPSTATEVDTDPTVEKVTRWARAWGHGGIIVVNAFAWRSTDPKELYDVGQPKGQANDQAILSAARVAGMVICGWGTHAAHPQFAGRAREVEALLLSVVEIVHCTKVNQGGTPKHPLYEPNAATPIVYRARTEEGAAERMKVQDACANFVPGMCIQAKGMPEPREIESIKLTKRRGKFPYTIQTKPFGGVIATFTCAGWADCIVPPAASPVQEGTAQ